MAYSIQLLNDQPYAKHFLPSSHVTLYCYFKDSTGQKVDLSAGGTVLIEQWDGAAWNPVTGLIEMEGLTRVDPGDPLHIGHYSYKFLTDGLTIGQYRATFSGTGVVTVQGTFDLMSIPPEQEMIKRLRAMLSDEVTSQYLLDDPTKFKWEDGKLYMFLTNALNTINEFPPYGYTFTFSTVPWIDLTLWGAMIEALFSLARLEIDNTLSYNDEISLLIDRAPKYLSLAQAMMPMWRERLTLAKRNYAIRMAAPIGIKALKLPLTVIRPLSLRDEMAATFGGML